MELLDTTVMLNDGQPNTFISPASGMACMLPRKDARGRFVQSWVTQFKVEPAPLSLIEAGATDFRCTRPIDVWWRTPILHTDGIVFTREWVVTIPSNPEGGAHVAPEIDQDYHDLTRLDKVPLWARYIEGNAVNPPDQIIAPERVTNISHEGSGKLVAMALLRQIAHEVIMTFSPNAARYNLECKRIYLGEPQMLWVKGYCHLGPLAKAMPLAH